MTLMEDKISDSKPFFELIPHLKTHCLNENKDLILKTCCKSGSSSSNAKSMSSNGISWLHFVLSVHIIMLYFIVVCLYNELIRTQETLNEFQSNMINFSMKGLEMEKNCLLEIEKVKQIFSVNSVHRHKRDLQFTVDSLKINPDTSIGNENCFTNSTKCYSRRIVRSPYNNKSRKAENERRGKKHKNKHRRRRAHGFLPKAAHFVGLFPEPISRDGGILAPWILDKDAVKDFALVTKVPPKGREAVEIIDKGLYFIYAQVYYLSPYNATSSHSSFYIMVKTDSGGEVPLAQCSTLADSSHGGEVSCFTAISRSLMPGDVVYIKQRERGRHIVMKPNQTFLGIILLHKKFNGATSQTQPPTVSQARSVKPRSIPQTTDSLPTGS